MKALFLLLYTLLFYMHSIHAQTPDYTPYEYMYKKQPAKDSAANHTMYNQHTHIDTSSIAVDTATVIGFAIAPLYKKQPESPLGNLMADCMKWYAEKRYDTTVDAAFVNFSSMRSYIPKGEITTGSILKVMPYNNKIVLLAVQGTILQQFLNHQASLGGWPCAGISMTIQDKEAVDVLINNQPLKADYTYMIAVADYIANGGNQCTMLKGLPRLDNNSVFRTALIDYIGAFTKAGKPVSALIQNRIVYR